MPVEGAGVVEVPMHGLNNAVVDLTDRDAGLARLR